MLHLTVWCHLIKQVNDDPLNTAKDSAWARYWLDHDLYDEIKKDVLRTHPDLQVWGKAGQRSD
jgi:hypothetical protein